MSRKRTDFYDTRYHTHTQIIIIIIIVYSLQLLKLQHKNETYENITLNYNFGQIQQQK